MLRISFEIHQQQEKYHMRPSQLYLSGDMGTRAVSCFARARHHTALSTVQSTWQVPSAPRFGGQRYDDELN